MQGAKRESSFVFTLARSASQNVADGYYDVKDADKRPARLLAKRSLKRSLEGSKFTPLIAEIKFTSPAEGKLKPPGDVRKIARAYQSGGVVGISVLTEPRHFDGDIRYLPLVKRAVEVPVLMKDVFVDTVQVDAAAEMGADAILFIAAIFMNRLAKAPLGEMFAKAHGYGLEVVLEAHTENEFMFALDSEADIVGINNRDLDTLEVSVNTTSRLMAACAAEVERQRDKGKKKPVISESGISSKQEVDQMIAAGADGVLVGSAIIKSDDLEAKVRALTGKRK